VGGGKASNGKKNNAFIDARRRESRHRSRRRLAKVSAQMWAGEEGDAYGRTSKKTQVKNGLLIR